MMEIPSIKPNMAERVRTHVVALLPWLRRCFIPLMVLWLLVLSLWVIANQSKVSTLMQAAQDTTQKAQVRALQSNLADLAQRVKGLEQLPVPIDQVSFTKAQQMSAEQIAALEQRLNAVDVAAVNVTALEHEMAVMRDRLEQLDAQVNKMQPTATPAPIPIPASTSSLLPSSSQSAKPPVAAQLPSPPFRLIGTELRGGEAFLAIAPKKGQSLAQTQLLRPGDRVGRWQLESLDSKTATFRVGGQLRTLTLP